MEQVEGGKTKIRIYCIRKEDVLSKLKKKKRLDCSKVDILFVMIIDEYKLVQELDFHDIRKLKGKLSMSI